MTNVFDITAFGAVGDGRTDCTAAVQEAIEAASGCRGKVTVPPGVYMVGHLRLHGQGVSLEGCAAWSYRSDGASVFRLNTADTDCMIDISGAFGCVIRGMCLDGCRLGKNIHGVKLWWEKYNGGSEEDTPTVDDCRIGNFSGDGLHFAHVWCFSVRHSMLHSNGGAGLYIDGWDAFILDNWFSNNGGGGIRGGQIVSSVTCTGNRVEWNRRGGFVLPHGDSYNITGNFFDRSFGPALELGAADGGVSLVTVTGNVFRRSGAHPEGEPFEDADMSCHVRLCCCDGVAVSGNSMRVGCNDGGGGVLSPDRGCIIENCRECVIRDNVMQRGALVANLDVRGENPQCLIADNVGSLAEPEG